MRLFDTPGKWAGWLLLLIAGMTAYTLVMDRLAPSTSDASVQAPLIPVATRISGQIEQIAVVNGDQVDAGDLLVKLEQTRYQQALESANVGLQLARQRLDAAKATNAGATSDPEASAATAERESADPSASIDAAVAVHQAEIALAEARRTLAATELRAPAAGIVIGLEAAAGSPVEADQRLLSLIDAQGWAVVAAIKENALAQIQPGQPVLVSINSEPGRIVTGQVRRISPGVQTALAGAAGTLPRAEPTRSWIRPAQRFPIEIALNDPSALPLRVGATAIVTIETSPNRLVNSLARAGHWLKTNLQRLY
jgi:RND family efflux transporter MFP subunit